MAGIAANLYNILFRRNPVFLATVFTGAFLFEIGFGNTMNSIWDRNNRGRQWKDIRHKYVQSEEPEEEEEDE